MWLEQLSKEVILRKLITKSHINYETGCFLVTGCKDNTYGSVCFNLGNKVFKYMEAHRLSAYLFHGLNIIDKGQKALHKTTCNNRNCWAPNHIYVGTHQDNMSDIIKAGRNYHKNKTHCSNGHEFNSVNTYMYGDERQCRVCRRERYAEMKALKKTIKEI